ncbi:hypothetical protein PAPYR_1038 [Paratrimastix pyriformis]|uniref:Uncharacterized protein n=1 Tax=Paratrimastix pyriformis TaxID=342808 RepID=A0ABQ8UWA7_9EUKA|nr:hypothetical protein PAPYR_1038 [Paratrimastix pyriformis]
MDFRPYHLRGESPRLDTDTTYTTFHDSRLLNEPLVKDVTPRSSHSETTLSPSPARTVPAPTFPDGSIHPFQIPGRPFFSLICRDVAEFIPSRLNIRKIPRDLNDVSDILGTQSSPKNRGFERTQVLNPLDPGYTNLDGSPSEPPCLPPFYAPSHTRPQTPPQAPILANLPRGCPATRVELAMYRTGNVTSPQQMASEMGMVAGEMSTEPEIPSAAAAAFS